MSGRFLTVQIGTWATSVGKDTVAKVVNDFDCVRNDDINRFISNDALDFAQRQVSVSHLVFDRETANCLGYFTLTHKPFSIDAGHLSGTARKRMERFAKCKGGGDEKTYTVSAFLIAQLGKNYNVPEADRISGTELIELAFDKLRVAQYEIGGQVVFLECEDGNPKLKAFYEKNAFVACGKRTNEEDGITYLQMFRFLKATTGRAV